MKEQRERATLAPEPNYPPRPEAIPDFRVTDSGYACRFARTPEDLVRVLRLRYEVFNLELGEGLDESHSSGLDHDRFDAHCHHLMVEHLATGRVVGTYRLQLREMADAGHGFYSAQEFDFSHWPDEVLDQSVEVGRACIDREHRHRNVLLQLWKGLGAYTFFHRRHYFFGCCSLTSQDPVEAARVLELLRRHGHVHPTLELFPQPDYRCLTGLESTEGWERARLPILFRTYLRYGARVCGLPAMDREFKTIDYLALLDLKAMDPEQILRQFELDIRQLP